MQTPHDACLHAGGPEAWVSLPASVWEGQVCVHSVREVPGCANEALGGTAGPWTLVIGALAGNSPTKLAPGITYHLPMAAL